MVAIASDGIRLCACGCGRELPPWKRRKSGRSEPRFLKGHHWFVPAHRRKPKPIADRFWPKVEKTEGCWFWKAAKHPRGYGQIHDNDRGRMVSAHIVAYELTVGPVPEGMELDHLCRNTSCVRPDHLEPVTHAENVWRGESGSFGGPVKNAAKRRCPQGHPYSKENTYVGPKGTRFCRACARARQRKRRALLVSEGGRVEDAGRRS